MNLFEVLTTEHNGRQEYWSSHLVTAVNLNQAWKRARKYFKNWYEDNDNSHCDSNNPDRFEFVDGSIILEIDIIKETTVEDWIAKQIELNSIDKIPKALLSCKRCKALLNACEYIRDCLDVGGEQSRQFSEEIRILREVIGYPEPVMDECDELQRRKILAEKLRRLSVEAKGILIRLPENPIHQWFDKTYHNASIDMQFEEVDLNKLLRFIVEMGVNPET